jgi:hypothetical protein
MRPILVESGDSLRGNANRRQGRREQRSGTPLAGRCCAETSVAPLADGPAPQEVPRDQALVINLACAFGEVIATC